MHGARGLGRSDLPTFPSSSAVTSHLGSVHGYELIVMCEKYEGLSLGRQRYECPIIYLKTLIKKKNKMCLSLFPPQPASPATS